MAIRNILRGDDPTLVKKSRVVTDYNKRLHILLDDMRETLLEANGLGLAAPQVGVLRRTVLVVDLSIDAEDPEEQIIELVNPEIVACSGEQNGSEGCLSVPGVYGMVTRPEHVRVRARDRWGDGFELVCSDITARAVCHEIDHLNGVIFTTLTDHFLTEEELEQMRLEKEAEAEALAAEEEKLAAVEEELAAVEETLAAAKETLAAMNEALAATQKALAATQEALAAEAAQAAEEATDK